MIEFVHNPDADIRIGDHIRWGLASDVWKRVFAAVAFVKTSGVRHLDEAIARFGDRGGVARIAVGVDTQGSSIEGLRLLMDSLRGDSRLCVVHNEADSTFHPKLWLFENQECAELLIGSGNLTGGGLFTNYEAALRVSLNMDEADDAAALVAIRNVLTRWTTPDDQTVRELNVDLLNALVASGYIVSESAMRERLSRQHVHEGPPGSYNAPLFVGVRVPPPPVVRTSVSTGGSPQGRTSTRYTVDALPRFHQGFVMTLQRTDVGVGQTRSGTSRRSPEIFIPLAARNASPEFWDWPEKFTEDPNKPGKRDRVGVRIRLGGAVVLVNMMTWPDKRDFRLRSEALRSAGEVGDLLRLEKADGTTYDYYAEIVPRNTAMFDEFKRFATERVRNSRKEYGYYQSRPAETEDSL